ATGSRPTWNASRQLLTSTVTSPDENIPTGKPIESIPIMTARDFAGQISKSRVGVITRIPPTVSPEISLSMTTCSHEVAREIANVNKPNSPTDSDSALTLPILSLMNPQKKPPAAHPAMYSA